MAMPSLTGEYYGPAPEVPADFDISLLNGYGTYSNNPVAEDHWNLQQHHYHPQHHFKDQQTCHIPVPKSEPIDQIDYFEGGNWQWPTHLHPGQVPLNAMAYPPTGSPSNQQLQLSTDPPTPAAECQVTSTNLSPMQSPYSPLSEVGSYDGAINHGDSFIPGEGASHFDTTDLNEVNIKGLTEEQLVSLTARDLNRICREMPEDIVKQLKKRRRTLKNRGYAYNSRVRRVTQKTALETERDDLKQQIQQLTDRCRFLEKEADQWKRKAMTLERGQL